mmetsp:Transcript_60911/g.170333  ORF Transcript_60911/g.170333 Transcript_60911/m.170333 type:complete len:150 (-) Transcript_60911:8-457(-)
MLGAYAVIPNGLCLYSTTRARVTLAASEASNVGAFVSLRPSLSRRRAFLTATTCTAWRRAISLEHAAVIARPTTELKDANDASSAPRPRHALPTGSHASAKESVAFSADLLLPALATPANGVAMGNMMGVRLQHACVERQCASCPQCHS